MIIITDSAADMTFAEAAKSGVKIITMDVVFPNGQIKKDGVDISPKEFYKELCKFSEGVPRTSQPSPNVFERAFREAKDKNEELVAILLSSKLSGTYQSAKIVAERCGWPGIHLVDSQSATIGEKLLIRHAVVLRDMGLSASAVAEELRSIADRLQILAVVDDLKHLHKGGRLPAAVAVVGGALGIKPILSVKNGEISVAGKGRGKAAAYKLLLQKIEENGGVDPRFGVQIGYTDDLRNADSIKEYSAKIHAKTLLTQIGAVIGTHIGPGAAGIAFVSKGISVLEKREQ